MNLEFNFIKNGYKKSYFIILTFLILFIPKLALGVDFAPVKDISCNKAWTIKFSKPINVSTINDLSATVIDFAGKKVPITITLGADNKSILVQPPVGGYIPSADYELTINQTVKSSENSILKELTKMKFKTKNEAEDGTSYYNAPTITSVSFDKSPVVTTDKPSINIVPKYTGNVQIRIFTSQGTSSTYKEITSGYTPSVLGNTNYKVNSQSTFLQGKNTLYIYVKKAGTIGTHKDKNTDYDNYYMYYFNSLGSITTEIFEKDNIQPQYTFKDMVDSEYSKSPVYYNRGIWSKASRNMVEYYLNINNFLDDNGKYQFLKLNFNENITAATLDDSLKGKGVLDGKGQVFYDAAKKADINQAYLVSHALLETGNGTSNLSKGITLTSYDGKILDKPVIVYNMFGIKAYDNDPDGCGSNAAYKYGWTDIDKAIMGGAAYISSDYINNDYHQYTIYKMRWNSTPNAMWKQYATDINWASAQTPNIKKLVDQFKDCKFEYELPQYK